MGLFCTAVHGPPVTPLHLWALLAAHRTKGGRTERGKGGLDYATEKKEDSREDGWGGDADGTLGENSSASGASSTEDDKSSMEVADGI